MSCVSVAQPCSYQLLSEVVKQEDFWAKFENTASELHRLIRVINKDLHRRFERLVFLSWLLQCNRFPYKEETTNEWFGYNVPGEPEQREIRTLNVSLNEEERKQWQRWQNIVEERADLPDLRDTLFFHGTSHESALKILREKIDITKGGERLDFSDGEGFYVTDDFSESIQYAVEARSRGSNHANLGAAVLIYVVDEEELKQFRGLDLNDNLEKWRKVVKEYRQIERRRIDSELREQLEHNSFIQGPISSTRRDGEF